MTEIYFGLSGGGELWRALDDAEEVVELVPGCCATIPPSVALHQGRGATIPCGAAFQFRATGQDPLRVVILTTPLWPGAEEAAIPRIAGT